MKKESKRDILFVVVGIIMLGLILFLDLAFNLQIPIGVLLLIIAMLSTYFGKWHIMLDKVSKAVLKKAIKKDIINMSVALIFLCVALILKEVTRITMSIGALGAIAVLIEMVNGFAGQWKYSNESENENEDEADKPEVFIPRHPPSKDTKKEIKYACFTQSAPEENVPYKHVRDLEMFEENEKFRLKIDELEDEVQEAEKKVDNYCILIDSSQLYVHKIIGLMYKHNLKLNISERFGNTKVRFSFVYINGCDGITYESDYAGYDETIEGACEDYYKKMISAGGIEYEGKHIEVSNVTSENDLE